MSRLHPALRPNHSMLFGDDVLLKHSTATFACAAQRWIYYDGTVTGPFASGQIARINISGRWYALCENARKNYCDADPMDATAWDSLGSETVDGAVGSGPIPGQTYDRINFSAAAGDGRSVDISTAGDNAVMSTSIFVATASGTKQFRIQVTKKDGTTAVSSDLTATTAWQRLDLSGVDVLSGGTTPSVAVINDSGGAAGALLVSCLQAEAGVFPTSPILTAGATRPGSQLYWTGPPVEMQTGKWAYSWIPLASTTDGYGTAGVFTLYGIDDGISWADLLSYSSPAQTGKLNGYPRGGGGGANMLGGWAVTHDRYQTLAHYFDSAAGTVTLAGYTTGDGLKTGSSWEWTAGTIVTCGYNVGLVWPASALISEPFKW